MSYLLLAINTSENEGLDLQEVIWVRLLRPPRFSGPPIGEGARNRASPLCSTTINTALPPLLHPPPPTSISNTSLARPNSCAARFLLPSPPVARAEPFGVADLSTPPSHDAALPGWIGRRCWWSSWLRGRGRPARAAKFQKGLFASPHFYSWPRCRCRLKDQSLHFTTIPFSCDLV